MINLQDYIVKSTLFRTIEVDDLLLVEYKCLVEDHESDIWAHQDYFAYVLGGEKKWSTPTNSVRVGSGDLLYVRKGATTVYQYFDQPFFVIFLFISEEFIGHILCKYPHLVTSKRHLHLDNNHLLKVELNSVLKSYFETMKTFLTQSVPLRKEVLKLQIEALLLDILTQPGNEFLKSHFIRHLEAGKVVVGEIMQANYMKPLAIKDYARMCGRSLSSFRRDFVKTYHTPPGKWLLKKRLEHSRFLLDTTTDRISEILYSAGFNNRAHFNKAFKNAYGMAPNNYRQQPVMP